MTPAQCCPRVANSPLPLLLLSLLFLPLAHSFLSSSSSDEAPDSVPEEWVLLHVVQGQIGAGNYSYLRLNHDGRIVLHMRSLRGDADLYVSDRTLRPSFDSYKLQSATCGADTVVVPGDFARPVGIGIYGHPSHQESEFMMRVFLDHSAPLEELESEMETGQRQRRREERDNEELEEGESFFWTVLIGLIKVILEILF